MRTPLIVGALVSLTALSGISKAVAPMGDDMLLDGMSPSGTELRNDARTNGSLVKFTNIRVLDAAFSNLDTASLHPRTMVVGTNDIQFYGAVLSQRSGERYRQ